jgi:hypothetical protein
MFGPYQQKPKLYSWKTFLSRQNRSHQFYPRLVEAMSNYENSFKQKALLQFMMVARYAKIILLQSWKILQGWWVFLVEVRYG